MASDEQITEEESKALWDRCGPLQIKMIEKNEPCKHEVGDTFCYRNPYARPEGVCHALLHVLELYIWRVALDFPSWESDNCRIYRIHCPAKNGTVWELQKSELPK
jgi:uncharacterized repeat protein (TIGR04076 family)